MNAADISRVKLGLFESSDGFALALTDAKKSANLASNFVSGVNNGWHDFGPENPNLLIFAKERLFDFL